MEPIKIEQLKHDDITISHYPKYEKIEIIQYEGEGEYAVVHLEGWKVTEFLQALGEIAGKGQQEKNMRDIRDMVSGCIMGEDYELDGGTFEELLQGYIIIKK